MEDAVREGEGDTKCARLRLRLLTNATSTECARAFADTTFPLFIEHTRIAGIAIAYPVSPKTNTYYATYPPSAPLPAYDACAPYFVRACSSSPLFLDDPDTGTRVVYVARSVGAASAVAVLSLAGKEAWRDDERDAVASLATQALTIFFDRAQREAAEAREASLRSVIEEAGDGIIVLDEKGTICEGNSAFARMVGIAKEELCMKRIFDCLETRTANDIPFDALEGGATILHECHVQREDGTRVPVEVNVRMRSDGTLVGVVRDITKRKAYEEHFSRVLEATSDGVWDRNVRTGTMWCNAQYFTMLGYAVHELPETVDAWYSLVHPDDISRVRKDIEHAFRVGRESFEFEARMRKKDGEWSWHLVRGRIVERDAEGRPLRVIGNQADITTQKLIEEELKESLHNLHITLDSIGDGVIVIDAKGRVTRMNPVAARLTGLDAHEAVGKAVRDVFRAYDLLTGREVTNLAERALIENERAQTSSRMTLILRNGTHIPIDNHTSLIRDGGGNVIGVVMVFRDITEKHCFEVSLRNSEERYRTLIEHAPDAVAVVDGTSCLLSDMNTNALRLFGFSRADISRKTLFDVVADDPEDKYHPDDAIREMVTLALQHRVYHCERYIKKEGRTPVPCDVRLVRIPPYEKTELRLSVTEITERKAREKEVESQRRMLQFISAFQQGIYLLATAEILDKAFDTLREIVEDVLIVVIDWEKHEYALRGTMGTDSVVRTGGVQDLACSLFFTVIDSHETTYVPFVDEETVALRGDFDGIKKYGIRSYYSVPFLREHECIGALAVASRKEDGITESTRNLLSIIVPSLSLSLFNSLLYEKAIENEEKYRALIEYAPDAISIVDAETGYYVDANKSTERLYKMPLDKICMRKVGDFSSSRNVPDGDEHVFLEEKLREALTHEVFLDEWYIIDAEGNEVPSEIRLMKFPGGDRNYVRISIVDITAKKRAEEERELRNQMLIQADKLTALGELSAGMAHEISQPLTGISMSADNTLFRVLDGMLSPEYVQEKMKNILDYVDRIKSIIDHIRLFSREQSALLSLSFSMNEGVRNALSLVGTQYANHGIDLLVDLADDVQPISGNVYRFEQVVLNLLSNAKDAVGEREEREGKGYAKRIHIHTSMKEGDAVLEICDNGVGIPEHERMNIFTPFYSTKPVDKGTGLGLSVVYGIIKEMKGEIEVFGTEGEGTTIRVSLPARDSATASEQEATD